VIVSHQLKLEAICKTGTIWAGAICEAVVINGLTDAAINAGPIQN
jgi:hypothetical protein